MREQLRKEIVKRTGEYVHSAAAAAVYEEESAKITASYDQMVSEGKSELEAYRAMLDDIEAMKILLAAIPPSEAEQSANTEESKWGQFWENHNKRRAEKKEKKEFRKMVGSMQALLWLLTPIWYFLYSYHSGNWATSWLTFLGSAAGSVLLDIIIKHNEGTPWKQCGGWHGVFWIVLTMFYFLTSFHWGNWATSWLLFPAGAAVEVLWGMGKKK